MKKRSHAPARKASKKASHRKATKRARKSPSEEGAQADEQEDEEIHVRAKMTVENVTLHNGHERVRLRAVHGGDRNDEDNSFAAATPVADLNMTIDNPKAHGFFVEGESVYLDFSKADADDQNAYPVEE